MFFASFAFRLAYLNQIQSMPTVTYPIMDERYHIGLANEIYSESGAAPEPYFRAPPYPYLLAVVYNLTSHSLYWSRLFQVFLGSFLPLLVLAIGLRLFSRSVSLWAAAIAVVYPTFLYYDVSLLITSLMTLLVVLLAWQLFRTERSPGWLNFALSGFLLGLAGLARPNVLLVGPVLLIWVWVIMKKQVGMRRALVGYMIIGAVALLTILPVTIRNYAVSGDAVFIAWQGGFNFFLGNNRVSKGWQAKVSGIDPSWQGGYQQSIAMAEAAEKRSLKRSEVSDFWYRMAWREIRESPGHFVKLLAQKLRLLINGYEIPNNQPIYMVRDFSSIISPLMFANVLYFPYGILAPLALVGIALSLRTWRRYLLLYLLLGSYTLTLMLFFVCTRFRQPLVPILLLFAVYAVAQGIEMFRNKSFKNLILVIFFAALLMVESNHNLLGLSPEKTKSESMFVLGTNYLERGDITQGEKYMNDAVRSDSTNVRAWLNLGYINGQRGMAYQALRCFERALSLDPTLPEAYFNTATALESVNRRDDAIALLERGIRVLPLNDNLHFKLGSLYIQAGRIDEGRTSLKECLRLNPANALARRILNESQNPDRDPQGISN
ncbi:MAG: tetratricopeptide repeat protein [Planctomycetota bacterium]